MPLPTQDRDQLVMDDLDDLLAGVEAGQDLLADSPLANAPHKLFDDLEVDVGLEQGQADLSQGSVEIGLGDLGFATQALSDALQARGKGFEPVPGGCGGSGMRAPGARAANPTTGHPRGQSPRRAGQALNSHST